MRIGTERIGSKTRFPSWIRHEHLARYKFAARFVRGKIVVDCACGTGIGSIFFAGAGAQRVEAFDVSQEAISEAQSSSTSPNVHFRVGSALQLPLPSDCADVYVALETIEHIEQDQLFLREAARVLRPGGLLICSTPNRTVTNPGKQLRHKPWNRFHVREYAEQEFLDILETTFRPVELFGQNPTALSRVRAMDKLGRVLPFHGAVRLSQFLKLAGLLWDSPEKHKVIQSISHKIVCEYLVAVCTNMPARIAENSL